MNTFATKIAPLASIVVVLTTLFGTHAGAYAAPTRLKTAIEIPAYLEATTGTSRRRTEVQEFYVGREGLLPQTGALVEMTAQSVTVSIGLAAIYCARMVQQDSLKTDASKRWAHKMINFSESPKLVYQGAAQDALLEDYAKMFWFRDLMPDEVSELKSLLADQIAKLPAAPASHLKILTGLCTAMTSSFEALSY